MAIPISNVNSVSDNFLNWLDKTNQVLDNLSTKIVTTEANTSGGVTSGNAYIQGVVSANVVAAVSALRGGNVSSSNTLFITSNAAFTNATANVLVLSSNTTTSKLTANIAEITLNSTNVSIATGTLTISSNAVFTGAVNLSNVSFSGSINSTSNASITGTLTVGANAIVNGQLIVSNTAALGNTTITGFANISSTLTAGNTAVGTLSAGNTTITGFANISSYIDVGSDLTINTTSIKVGNSTSNSTIAHNQMKVGNTTVNTTINPAVINVGANVSLNVSSIKIGNTVANAVLTDGILTIQSNSTVNSTLSSTTLTIANVTATNISATTLSGNVSANSITSGTIDVNRLGSSGTRDGTTFLRGDNSWAVVDTVVNLSVASNSTSFSINNDKGDDAVITSANSSAAGVMSSSDKSKLDGIANGAQTGTVTSIATNNGVTGGTITTTGTIGLTGQALSVHNLSSNGFFVRANSTSVVARSVAGGTGISVTNGDGVSGNPTVAVDSTAAIQVAALGVGTSAGSNGTIRATSDIVSHFSDERLKDIQGNIVNALDKVSSLSGFYFKENAIAKSLGFNNESLQVGVSAQKVQAIMPEVVKAAPVSSEYLTVQYEKLVPLLIEAIKELDAKVKDLTKKLEE